MRIIGEAMVAYHLVPPLSSASSVSTLIINIGPFQIQQNRPFECAAGMLGGLLGGCLGAKASGTTTVKMLVGKTAFAKLAVIGVGTVTGSAVTLCLAVYGLNRWRSTGSPKGAEGGGACLIEHLPSLLKATGPWDVCVNSLAAAVSFSPLWLSSRV